MILECNGFYNIYFYPGKYSVDVKVNSANPFVRFLCRGFRTFGVCGNPRIWTNQEALTLPMLRLLSSKSQECNYP